MGCFCLGPTIKLNSTISVSNQLYSQIEEVKKLGNKEEKSYQDFSKSINSKVEIECSNISSSRLSFSDDVQKDEERENEKNN